MPSGNFSPMKTRRFKEKPCRLCGKVFRPVYPRSERCRPCQIARCQKCRKLLRGIHLARLAKKMRLCMSCWKQRIPVGSVRKDYRGYVSVKTETGWKFEHRYVMEKMLGRALSKSEVVHHRNGNGTDNRPENLVLVKDFYHHLNIEHAEDKKRWGRKEMLRRWASDRENQLKILAKARNLRLSRISERIAAAEKNGD